MLTLLHVGVAKIIRMSLLLGQNRGMRRGCNFDMQIKKKRKKNNRRGMTLLSIITLLNLSIESTTYISDKIFSSINPSANNYVSCYLWSHCIIFLDFF
jgi:hypothetical protein